MATAKRPKAVVFEPVIVVDTREQLSYSFAKMTTDARQGGGPLKVRTERRKLDTGDYSIAGMEALVTVERKSKEDLFGTLTTGRDRFERELVRMQAMGHAAVVCEAEWSEVLNDPPEYSKTSPKSIYRSVLAWQQRYPGVHWHFVPGRAVAEVWTFRILQRFVVEQVANKETEMAKPEGERHE